MSELFCNMGIAAIGDSLGQILFCKFCIFLNGQTIAKQSGHAPVGEFVEGRQATARQVW